MIARDGTVVWAGRDGTLAVQRVANAELHAIVLTRGRAFAAGTDQVIVMFDGRHGPWRELRRVPGGGALLSAVAGPDGVWFGGDRGLLIRWDGIRQFEHRIQENPAFPVELMARYGTEVAISLGGRIHAISPQWERRILFKPETPPRAMFGWEGDFLYYSSGGSVQAVRNQFETTVFAPMTCPIRSIFGSATNDMWVLTSDKAHSGLAHYDGRGWKEHGSC